MPASMRSKGRSSSARHQSTFWTLTELARPQIVSLLMARLAFAFGALLLERAEPKHKTSKCKEAPHFGGASCAVRQSSDNHRDRHTRQPELNSAAAPNLVSSPYMRGERAKPCARS